jgi:hypothetical protein
MIAGERKRAMEAGEGKYLSLTLCPKHPELRGEKYVSGGCVGCVRARAIAARRLKISGVDQGTYDRLWDEQGGRCAICGVDFRGRKACADHCHDTNTPRGLLCDPCNLLEGWIRKRGINAKEFAEKLFAYLARTETKSQKSQANG